jgi:hypothetical protein
MLARDQVIEALFDLLNQNPNLSCMIVEALKREFKKQSSKWIPKLTLLILDKNCVIPNKEFHALFIKLFLGEK